MDMTDHKICNARDYQLAARSILPKAIYEYLASGTDDEQTLSENVSPKRRGWRPITPIRIITPTYVKHDFNFVVRSTDECII